MARRRGEIRMRHRPGGVCRLMAQRRVGLFLRLSPPLRVAHALDSEIDREAAMRLFVLTVGSAMLLSNGLAHGQVIYKCVEKGKPTSFQTSPCPASAKVADAKGFTPERELTWQEKRQREAQWATPRHQQTASAASIPIPTVTPSARSQCEMARAQREQWERSAGLKRSYDGVRAWNDRVARACN
jgi:hypothetical protein